MTKRVPTTYSDASNQLSELIKDISVAKDIFAAGASRLQDAIDRLTGLNTTAANDGYSDMVAYVSAQATANPNDEQWQFLQAEVSKALSDFAADKSSMQAKITAFNNA